MSGAIKFGSVCSGIEAASVAWHPLGWRAAWLAEIEPFPCAVLAHHYPTVPNLGDMTAIAARVRSGSVAAPDVFTGGTPCQAFSVAGLRKSLDDARGNLSLTFCEIADAIDDVRHAAGQPECIIVWENVPGVLSTKDNAFGCFLGALAGCDTAIEPLAATGWTDAGVVAGPRRAVAWRILDAQYFGLAQRRKRVFVVASARDNFDPATVLFEWEGVRRDTAPRREAGQDTAATLDARTQGGGFPGTDGACGGHVVPAATAGALTAACGPNGHGGSGLATDQGASAGHLIAFGGNNTAGPIDVATACNAHGGAKGRLDFESETFVTHSLRGEGFDASEDGTGRGTPLVPVAFSSKDHGADASADLAPTLRAMGHAGSHANGGGQMAVAFDPYNQKVSEVAHTLRQGSSTSDAIPQTVSAMQVRRLTPRECERLQGFPDDYTLIPWRGKPAADCPDGPRYKALGNSWAVPVVRWIAARIDVALRTYYQSTR